MTESTSPQWARQRSMMILLSCASCSTRSSERRTCRCRGASLNGSWRSIASSRSGFTRCVGMSACTMDSKGLATGGRRSTNPQRRQIIVLRTYRWSDVRYPLVKERTVGGWAMKVDRNGRLAFNRAVVFGAIGRVESEWRERRKMIIRRSRWWGETSLLSERFV